MPIDKDFLYSEIKELDKSIKDVSEQIVAVDKNVAEYKVAFENHTAMDEKMYGELSRMNDILMMNTESLKDHIRRTNLLEEYMPKLGERLSQLEITNIKADAVKAYRKDMLKLIAKVGTGIGAIVGAFMYIKPFLSLFIK